MKNFYEILQVEKNSDEKQIKKQYSMLIRQFHPEKYPEKYREIREAYDVLKDPKSKENYDISLLHGKQLQELEHVGREALENEDYVVAVKNFEQILEIDGKNSIIKNLLGETLLRQNRYKKALIIFFELFEEYPNNIGYICRLGFCNEMLGDLNKAEKLYTKAYEIEEKDKESVNWLINLYWNQKKYFKAEKFLKNDIYKDGTLDFSDFQSFNKLLETYIMMDEVGDLLKVINDMKKIIPNDVESRYNVAWEFARMGAMLQDAERYNYAEVFYKYSKSIAILEESHQIDERIKISKSYKLIENLLNDDKVIKEVKGPLITYFHHDKFEEDTRKNVWENFTNTLDIFNREVIDLMNDSILRIKSYYYELYEEKKELYNESLLILQRNKKILNSAGTFMNDYNICEGLKTCIAAILDKNDDNFEYGVSSLRRERIHTIRQDINYIKRNYRNFYDATSNFIDKLEASL